MSRLSASIITFFMVLGGAGVAHAQSVQWEIAHRYRLFSNEQHFRALLDVFRSLPAESRQNEPALALEHALEKESANSCLPDKLFGADDDQDRFGWSAAMIRGRTCFSATGRNHHQCTLDRIEQVSLPAPKRRNQCVTTGDSPTTQKQGGGDAFMDPRAADILVKIENLDTGDSKRQCRFTAKRSDAAANAAPVGSVTASCGLLARIHGIPYDTPFDIAVQRAENGALLAGLGQQVARHVFIAGLGDSFASGEGNPDQPVQLSGDQPPYDYERSTSMRGGDVRNYPVRAGQREVQSGGAAQPRWLNLQCHRSLYSQQAKASLALALEQPHLAVSFTGYACTGAKIDEGLLGYWKARDDVRKEQYDSSPQLMRLLRDYCADPSPYLAFRPPASGNFDWRQIVPCKARRVRPPDIVLLSIGGNDIGFVRVIAGQILGHSGNPAWRRPWPITQKLWLKGANPMSFEESKTLITEKFPANLIRLREALDIYLRPTAGVPSAYRVIQTGYPQLTQTATKPCTASTKGMDVHAAFKTKGETGPGGIDFIHFLNTRLSDSVTKIGSERWVFVADHAARFKEHAFCDGGAPSAESFGARNYKPDISGGMEFPFVMNKGNHFAWSPYRPEEWRAYRPRNRWIVTPNDGFNTGHYINSGMVESHGPFDKAMPMLASVLSGAFHPNALGHAAIADAVLPELRKQANVKAPGE